MTNATTERWSRRHWLALVAILLVGVAIRVVLLPTEGLRGDIDQFVGWVHHIATRGLGSLYGETDAGPVTFGPVMAYVWSLLAAIQPAFATTVDFERSGHPDADESPGVDRRRRGGAPRGPSPSAIDRAGPSAPRRRSCSTRRSST